MTHKRIKLVMLLLILSACSVDTRAQKAGKIIDILLIDQYIKNESTTNIPEQASNSDTVLDIETDTEQSGVKEIEPVEVENNSSNIMDNESMINDAALPAESIPENTPQKEEENHSMNMIITANGRSFNCTLYENETTYAFIEQLPLTITMSELNGNEKYYYLENSLPTNTFRPNEIHAGEVMLFGSDCLVLFYENFTSSFSYTSIGYVDDPVQLADILGKGSVQVTFTRG